MGLQPLRYFFPRRTGNPHSRSFRGLQIGPEIEFNPARVFTLRLKRIPQAVPLRILNLMLQVAAGSIFAGRILDRSLVKRIQGAIEGARRPPVPTRLRDST